MLEGLWAEEGLEGRHWAVSLQRRGGLGGPEVNFTLEEGQRGLLLLSSFDLPFVELTGEHIDVCHSLLVRTLLGGKYPQASCDFLLCLTHLLSLTPFPL